MHICLISEEYPSETGGGGIGTYTYNLAHGLAAEGNKVTVITGALKVDSEYIEDKIKIYRISRKNIKNVFLNFLLKKLAIVVFPRTLSYMEWSFRAAKKAAEINKSKKIDVIDAPEANAPAFFTTFFLKIPLVMKLHTPYEIHCKLNGMPINYDLKLLFFLEKRVIKRADKIVSMSKALVSYLNENRYMKINNVTVIPPLIDEMNFQPVPEGEKQGNKTKQLLFVGRIEQRKGVDILLEAFQKVWKQRQDVRLKLVGKDMKRFLNSSIMQYSEYLKHKADNKEFIKDVNFIGKIERIRLGGFYRHADICIFPSAVFENFPSACLEAMACGVPVIASDCGGYPEIIEDSVSGILVQPSNSEELAKAIIYLLENPHIRDKMGTEARKRVVELFAIKKVVLRNLSIYNDVIK